jgi:hypothetical protein
MGSVDHSSPTPTQYSPLVAAQPYQPQPTTFQVQLPAGIVAGQPIQVQHPKTNQMLILLSRMEYQQVECSTFRRRREV